MFDIGGPELIIILLAVILLFGPKRIPEFTKMMGKGIQKIRSAQSQFNSQINDIRSEIESQTDINSIANNNINIYKENPSNHIDSENNQYDNNIDNCYDKAPIK